MKRIFSLVLVLICVFSFGSLSVSADVGAQLSLTVNSATVHPGDEVTVTVALANAPAVKSVALVFDYDVASVFDVVDGAWVLSAAVLANFDSVTTPCGTAALAYATATDVNGTVFTLKLKVKSSAPAGETVITATPVLKNDAVTTSCAPATVKVTVAEASAVVPGDGNGDGRVTVADVRLALRSSVNKITLTDTQKAGLDVNNDGRVTVADVRLLLRYSVNKISHF